MKKIFVCRFTCYLLTVIVLCLNISSFCFAQTQKSSSATADGVSGYTPGKGNVAARDNFQNEKFGIFLHWGLYSMMAQGEWYMNVHNIDSKIYAQFAAGFYPSKFDAAKWISAIKAGGAKYICFTTRHHEGFSMFDTKYSDYNIVKATPFKRDVVKEIVDECHKQGIGVHFYYSLLDWTREDYYPLGTTGHGTGRWRDGDSTGRGGWSSYNRFMLNQLTELLTKYGKIDAIWLDGWWDQPEGFDWHLNEIYSLIHRLQPACLIGNNHHHIPFEGEDFQMFERDLPGENNAGLSGQKISSLPLETCETMNGMWGYKIADQNYKSAQTIIHYLVRAAGNNANLLLNIGPMPTGELPEVALERLEQVGNWLKINGESIYGTRGNTGIVPGKWGTSTRKGKSIYLHLLDKCDTTSFHDGSLSFKMEEKIKKAVEFPSMRPLKFKQSSGSVSIYPEKCLESGNTCKTGESANTEAADYIIKIELF